MNDFFLQLSKCNNFQACNSNYQPHSIVLDLPITLTTLADEKAQAMNFNELIKFCESVDISVSENQVKVAEQETRDQANSQLWFNIRSGRITTSKIKSVCSTDIALPSQSLIKPICYPDLMKFTSTATCWGCDHEKQARDFYFNLMKQNHTDFSVCDSGFNILQSKPFFGASPDGMVACDCCGEGTLEIKCPCCHKHDTIELAASNDKSFCIEKINDVYMLKKSHQYYYQVQTQISVCGKDYGDFVV